LSNLGRALLAEFVGTASLLAVVIGSGIMGERLSSSNPAVALLANSIATGLALYVLITIFGPISRSHFNPIVTFAAVVNREFTLRLAFEYCFVQLCGAIAGVWLAHVMFALPILQTSEHVRTGIGQWVSEAVATAGLLLTIGGCTRFARAQTAAAVGAYIAAAYWFTASTSFANPAVTVARAMSDTFAGIRPSDAPGFIVGQIAGMAIGLVAIRLLFGRTAVEPGAGPHPS
jgi:glycerol uptake facilitator-like aquaporin